MANKKSTNPTEVPTKNADNGNPVAVSLVSRVGNFVLSRFRSKIIPLPGGGCTQSRDGGTKPIRVSLKNSANMPSQQQDGKDKRGEVCGTGRSTHTSSGPHPSLTGGMSSPPYLLLANTLCEEEIPHSLNLSHADVTLGVSSKSVSIFA